MDLYNSFGKIKVKSYSIDQREVLGQGAFGVVFKGHDVKKSVIAAKRIHGNDHPRILTQDLDRFLQLDHPNVIKILDVEKTENIVWMMMPFCELGDLNHFYRKRVVPYETNISIMKQITAGINYLHNQDIVHRDIKPGNILVASETPLWLHLTDFDVSKCLDSELETSLMTSNVGTLAFKAPEFFQRTSAGQIEYHRNVDIYAAGLTFLAILQAEKGKKMLIPHIETPMEDSEYHVPSIGLLISERIKYRVPNLNIVDTEAGQGSLKLLISKMTCVNPEERFSARKVLDKLETAEMCLALEIQKINFTSERTCEQVPGLLKADVNQHEQILARVKTNDGYFIRVLDRFGSKESFPAITSACNHHTPCIITHPSDPHSVLEGCDPCGLIRNYNIHTGDCCIVYTGSRPIRMCHGPTGCIFVECHDLYSRTLLKLKWKKEERQPDIDKVYKNDVTIWKWCYAEFFKVLVIISESKDIQAVNFGSSSPIWKLSRIVGGHVVKPDDVTSDRNGNVYVSDGANNRILKINGSTGTVLTILQLEEKNKEPIRDLFWSDTEPNLILVRDDHITAWISLIDY